MPNFSLVFGGGIWDNTRHFARIKVRKPKKGKNKMKKLKMVVAAREVTDCGLMKIAFVFYGPRAIRLGLANW